MNNYDGAYVNSILVICHLFYVREYNYHCEIKINYIFISISRERLRKTPYIIYSFHTSPHIMMGLSNRAILLITTTTATTITTNFISKVPNVTYNNGTLVSMLKQTNFIGK